ncbi:hypothetical protein HY449_02300 [Candidatus Pacearchaeota archaeon]|nr:hypothetical protein [Candidatus Pacearchaeota archaeon]
MYENYGDVVLFDGNDRFSKIIRLFNGQQYIHSGLLVDENTASQLSRFGEEVLVNLLDSKDHDSCLILRHKKITSSDREMLKKYYEEIVRNSGYDMLAIVKLGIRHKFGIKPDGKNILRNGRNICCSLDSLVYERLTGLPVLEGVHYSQTEPHHFLQSQHFEIARKIKLK